MQNQNNKTADGSYYDGKCGNNKLFFLYNHHHC